MHDRGQISQINNYSAAHPIIGIYPEFRKVTIKIHTVHTVYIYIYSHRGFYCFSVVVGIQTFIAKID